MIETIGVMAISSEKVAIVEVKLVAKSDVNQVYTTLGYTSINWIEIGRLFI